MKIQRPLQTRPLPVPLPHPGCRRGQAHARAQIPSNRSNWCVCMCVRGKLAIPMLRAGKPTRPTCPATMLGSHSVRTYALQYFRPETPPLHNDAQIPARLYCSDPGSPTGARKSNLRLPAPPPPQSPKFTTCSPCAAITSDQVTSSECPVCINRSVCCS